MKKLKERSYIQNVQTKKMLVLSVTAIAKAWDLAESMGWRDPAWEAGSDDEVDDTDWNYVRYSASQAKTLARALELGWLDIQDAERAGSPLQCPAMYSGGYDDVSPRRYFAGKRKKLLIQMIGFLRQGACIVMMLDVLVSKSQRAEGLVMPKPRVEVGADKLYTDYSETLSEDGWAEDPYGSFDSENKLC
jgi:hypothetical protein